MSNLPKEIEDQINNREHELTMPMLLNNDHEIGYCQGFSVGYIKGATEWAEKAQGLMETLNFIFRMTYPGTHERIAAEEAMAKYKEVTK